MLFFIASKNYCPLNYHKAKVNFSLLFVFNALNNSFFLTPRNFRLRKIKFAYKNQSLTMKNSSYKNMISFHDQHTISKTQIILN